MVPNGLLSVLNCESFFSYELVIMHRLVYRTKNQHRPCVHFRHLVEVKRFAVIFQSSMIELTQWIIQYDNSQNIHALVSGKQLVSSSLHVLHRFLDKIRKCSFSFSRLLRLGFFVSLATVVFSVMGRLHAIVVGILHHLESFALSLQVNRNISTAKRTCDWDWDIWAKRIENEKVKRGELDCRKDDRVFAFDLPVSTSMTASESMTASASVSTNLLNASLESFLIDKNVAPQAEIAHPLLVTSKVVSSDSEQDEIDAIFGVSSLVEKQLVAHESEIMNMDVIENFLSGS